ncbi:sulfotransferase family protein [Streptomyces sp. TRM68416]|uniref:sulfotransferase family protein n=1 Tax=Streptomyces sp. TRM68416 TaxID=2758412 RepID=UPI001661BCC4|nr:sulfotransferase [Streptomyces sp. TRM68416]MBD0843782.1 sulfotransferase [Streptomyces sp. TRM68416]
MDWSGLEVRRVARGIRRRIRKRVVRPVPRSAHRLVPDPVFVLSSVRSGSTLLRVLLNSHPRIRAPHEMHLRTLTVGLGKPYTKKAMSELDLDQRELEFLLWDRILHRELVRSGKQIIVDKTPGNAAVWERLHEGWPRARYIFLLRHPASMVDSLIAGRPDRDPEATVREVLGYVEAVEAARTALPGLTVRYEELTERPVEVTQEICAFLGVEWTPRMLDYRRVDHGPFVPFIGDWSDTIKSGRVQKARPLPDPADVPPALRDIARTWGYPS